MIELLLALLLLDAPAPKLKSKPKPLPSPVVNIVEPIDIVPTDPPEDPFVHRVVYVAPPAPIPSPSPIDYVARANARPLRVESELGAVITTTGDAGTAVTPTFFVAVNGPMAFGSKHSLGRLGVRLGLSSSPGQSSFNPADIQNYKAVEVGVSIGRVVGVLGDVSTTVLAEGTFSSRLKGALQPPPLNRLSRSLGAGIRFEASKARANLTALVGYDEASASCNATVVCAGVNSGLALMAYGQVPIIKGAVLFGGDVTLSTGRSVPWLKRRDIERIFIVLDPVAIVSVIKGER